MVRIFLKLTIYLLMFLSFASYAHGQNTNSQNAAGQMQPSLNGHHYIEGELIIKLKGASGPTVLGRAAKSIHAGAFLSRASGQHNMSLRSSYPEMGVYHFKLKAGQRVSEALTNLKNDPDIEYAEPNFTFSKSSVVSATQYYTASQVVSMSSAASGGYLATGAAIEVTSSWGQVSRNTTPIVAIIDTGLDTAHPVFVGTGAVWTNPGEIPNNQIDDDRNGYIDDVHGFNFVSNTGEMIDDDGHGTHCAGIVLGVGQNIYGAAYSPSLIKIMPLKFLDGSGYGQTSDAIRAIYYAVNNGASVISNSWGGPDYSAALQEAIAYAYDAGVIFVAAAGNNSANNDVSTMYPANYTVPNVVSVAATTDDDSLAYFSDFGATSVPLAAPGMMIISTMPGGGFQTMSGTSMATPFVAGLAALMKAQQPGLLSYQAKQLIMGNIDVPQNSHGARLLAGKTSTQGRLNVYNTIEATKNATIQTDQPAYTFTNIDRQLASSIAASGCGLVKKMINEGPNDTFGGGQGAPESWSVLVVLGLFALPILIYNSLRRKEQVQRRQHDRFKIDTQVKVQVGGRDLVGSISSISLGGVQLNTDALIEQGGIVSMAIRSPDGAEQIKIEGRIVWSEDQKSYGVQFAETTATIREQISSWTTGLQKVPVKK